MSKRIALISPNRARRGWLTALERAGFVVDSAPSSEQSRILHYDCRYSGVLIGHDDPFFGPELFSKRLHAMDGYRNLPVVVLGGSSDTATCVRHDSAGIVARVGSGDIVRIDDLVAAALQHFGPP